MINLAYTMRNINSFREELRHDEDPTFLTFSIDFEFNSVPIQHLGLHSSPLFHGNGSMTDTDADFSAENFLAARGLTDQRQRLAAFKSILRDTANNKPWYFQTINGLDKMWENSSNMAEGFKAREITLEISTLESVDLKMSYLAELYRKAVTDTVYMREILPIGLRYFNMRVYVAEFREFGNYNFGIINPASPFSSQNVRNYFKEYVTYYMFDCYMCEFDFSKTFPSTEFTVAGFEDPATNRFAIKVGMFLEKHNFSYYDIAVEDSFAIHAVGRPKSGKTHKLDGKTGQLGSIR